MGRLLYDIPNTPARSYHASLDGYSDSLLRVFLVTWFGNKTTDGCPGRIGTNRIIQLSCTR